MTASPEMQRRHFVFIAQTIRDLVLPINTRNEVARHFADNLAHTNDHFDTERFLIACNGETYA